MNAATLNKMYTMRLMGMYRLFKTSLESGQAETLTADEFIAHLVEAEWDDRQNRRIERTILYAKFRYKAAIEDVHYHADRTIDRNQVMRLADCTFIDRFENLLITGNPFAGPGINPGATFCGTTGPAPDFAPGLTFDKLNEDNISWRGGVNWKPVEGTLVYANISRGYKSGSFPTVATASYVQLAPATQESLLAYESGVKARLLQGALQLNAAVFYYDYKDKQILGAISDVLFGALPSLVNVPKSHVIGFELNGIYRPDWLPGLTVTPAVSFQFSVNA